MTVPTELYLRKTFDRQSGTILQQKFTASIGTTPEPIEGIILKMQAADPISVQFRFLNTEGVWSEQKTAKLYLEPFSDRLFAVYKGPELFQSESVEIDISSESHFQILSTGLLLKESEESAEIEYALPEVFMSHIPKPRIITRAEWNAKPPQFGYTSMPYYDKLTLHHAAGFSASTIEEGVVQMQAIQELHQDVRGWSDIGYHFVVDKGGNIYQARPENVIGAHTSNANTGNLGVCVLGCYHPPETSYYCYDQMTQATRDSLIKLYAWISETYGYDNPHILKGHRDYYDYEYTSCPGDNIWALLPELRDEITLYLEYGDIPRSFVLHQNYPNPFNLTTAIPFDVASEGQVTISVVDIIGSPIKTLTNATYTPGYDYEINWDGKDEDGKRMGSGVYLYRIQSGDTDQSNKMILLK